MADDTGGEIAWTILSNTLVYAAEVAHEIADDLESIDRAMRWGYGWELGPFETWEALGVDNVCRRLEREGRSIPPLVKGLKRSARQVFTGAVGDHDVVFKNAGGQIVASDDDVAILTFYRTKASFDISCIELLEGALKSLELEWQGLIVTGEDGSFPSWINFYDLLNKARLKKWKDINAGLMTLQELAQRIRYFRKPIVFAAAASVSGIGAEICLAAPHRHLWVESTLWLDHLMLGLTPAAGGCLNMLRLCEEHESYARGPHPKAKRAFELIGSAARSTSAIDAKKMALVALTDGIVMDRDNLLDGAKGTLAKLAEDYVPPEQHDVVLPGRGGEMAIRAEMRSYMQRGLLRSDDATVCAHLARILTGGDHPTVHLTTEQHILDLEREAFLSLISTEMTQSRIEHYLKTGKYLR